MEKQINQSPARPQVFGNNGSEKKEGENGAEMINRKKKAKAKDAHN
jgi:hypothetical protein